MPNSGSPCITDSLWHTTCVETNQNYPNYSITYIVFVCWRDNACSRTLQIILTTYRLVYHVTKWLRIEKCPNPYFKGVKRMKLSKSESNVILNGWLCISNKLHVPMITIVHPNLPVSSGKFRVNLDQLWRIATQLCCAKIGRGNILLNKNCNIICQTNNPPWLINNHDAALSSHKKTKRWLTVERKLNDKGRVSGQQCTKIQKVMRNDKKTLVKTYGTR